MTYTVKTSITTHENVKPHTIMAEANLLRRAGARFKNLDKSIDYLRRKGYEITANS